MRSWFGSVDITLSVDPGYAGVEVSAVEKEGRAGGQGEEQADRGKKRSGSYNGRGGK